jgi:hypothetical protein
MVCHSSAAIFKSSHFAFRVTGFALFGCSMTGSSKPQHEASLLVRVVIFTIVMVGTLAPVVWVVYLQKTLPTNRKEPHGATVPATTAISPPGPEQPLSTSRPSLEANREKTTGNGP